MATVLLLAEAAIRLLHLDGYRAPELRDASGRPVEQLSRMTTFFGAPGERPAGSLTQMTPGTFVRGWYDRPRWSYFDGDGCIDYRINSQGFRDREFPVAKPAGELRIVAIGDSFTFGAGIRAEDNWVERLERDLAARDGGPVEVVNAGFAARDNAASYAPWIEEVAPRLAPDAVIVGFCLNDVSLDLPLWLPPAASPAPWLGGASRLLTLAQQAWDARHPSGRRARPLRIKPYLAGNRDDWTPVSAGLLSIQRSCAAMGARLVVVIFPLLSQLEEGYLLGEIHELVGGFCADHAIEHVDLLPAFLGRDERELWVHPTDQHLNDVAQRLAADALAAYFADHPFARR